MALRNITFKKTNIGGNTGNYFISIDSPRTLLASNVTRAQLEAGYTINNIDTTHTVFIISSTSSLCNNSVYVTIPYVADGTPPTQPTNLAGTGQGTYIPLSWDASTDNVAVTGYNIYRDTVYYDTSATNSYDDLSVTANTDYTYKVQAFDAANNLSEFSSSVTINSGDIEQLTII